MLAVIKLSDEKSRLYRDTRADFHLMHLELHKLRCAKRWIKKLAGCGVAWAVASDNLRNALEPALNKYHITPIEGRDILLAMSARIALCALRDNKIPLSHTGAEIYVGGEHSFEAIAECSRALRYVSACGRGSAQLIKRASDELGFSVVSRPLPAGLCDCILRLYFDGRPTLFSIKTRNADFQFGGVNIILPQKYEALCDDECKLSFAKALVQSGKLTVSQLGIGSVWLNNC